MFDTEKLKERIRPLMSDFRYRHTLSVAGECEKLALMLGVDPEPVVIAAYLHDITKEMSTEGQLSLCKEYGIEIDGDTIASPKTLHSFSAPALIKRDFPEYATPEILSAVSYHTTGRANMTVYEKILYLADYVEPTREYDDCIEVRICFYNNRTTPEKAMDEALLLSLKITIRQLLDDQRAVHPLTVNAYNDLLMKGGIKLG